MSQLSRKDFLDIVKGGGGHIDHRLVLTPEYETFQLAKDDVRHDGVHLVVHLTVLGRKLVLLESQAGVVEEHVDLVFLLLDLLESPSQSLEVGHIATILAELVGSHRILDFLIGGKVRPGERNDIEAF